MLSTGFLVGGDFNLIRSPNEKSNDRFDSRWPLLFNACIESLNLRELALSGRRFTWASSVEIPNFNCGSSHSRALRPYTTFA